MTDAQAPNIHLVKYQEDLFQAVTDGDLAALEQLATQYQCDNRPPLNEMRLSTFPRYTLFVAAAVAGHIDIMAWLYAHGHAAADTSALYYVDPLSEAAAAGQLTAVKWLIEKAGYDARGTEAYCRITPALFACVPHPSAAEIARYLIYERKVPADARDYQGMTLLHHAAGWRSFALIRFLVDEGLSSIDKPLNQTRYYGSTKMPIGSTALMLLIMGPFVTKTTTSINQVEQHPLDDAAQRKLADEVAWLVQISKSRGCSATYDCCYRNASHKTALDYAIASGNVHVVRVLLRITCPRHYKFALPPLTTPRCIVALLIEFGRSVVFEPEGAKALRQWEQEQLQPYADVMRPELNPNHTRQVMLTADLYWSPRDHKYFVPAVATTLRTAIAAVARLRVQRARLPEEVLYLIFSFLKGHDFIALETKPATSKKNYRPFDLSRWHGSFI